MAILMGDVVDRVFRDHLYAADDQPVRVRLAGAVDAAVPDWTLDLTLIPVDVVAAIAPGVLIEADREQALILAVADDVVTVARGVNGTDPAAHADGALVNIAPAFGRQQVFDAVADNVVALYPTLWAVKTEAVTVAHPYTEVPADTLNIVAFRAIYSVSHAFEAPARLITAFPDSSTGKAAVIDATAGQAGTIVYRGSFDRPTTDADDLELAGVRPGWERIVRVGAAAQLLFGRDTEPITQEVVTEQMQAESLPITTHGRIAARLLEYRDLLLKEAADALKLEDRKRVVRMPNRRSALR
jgi:hypothetical protein